MTVHKFSTFEVNGVLVPGPSAQVTINSKTTIKALYYEEPVMGTATIKGSVSDQYAAGETVTLTITRPNGAQDVLTVETLPDRTFTATYTEAVGSYILVASIAEDAQYEAATSGPVPFSIGKLPRTITVTVT